MKKYTEEQLLENYNKFLEAIKTCFKNERQEKLLHMYSMDELGSNLMLSPASGNKYYHNGYVGGYIDHVLNVARNSLKVMQLYKDMGGKLNFTQEELMFAAFHHDLGKLGIKGEMHYVPETSEWHIKNRGSLFVTNTNISWMTHTDRTFYLLSQYGIIYTEKEFFGIKLTDGMYDEDNVKYLKTYDNNKAQRSNIAYILHCADFLSSKIELEMMEDKK
jgi:hypothetical protein